MDFEQAVRSSLRELGSEEIENEEMGQQQTVEAIGLEKRPRASTPNAIADDCPGDCTRVKFQHSPILYYAFSSWIEKTMTKTIHCHRENRFVLH